VISTATTQEINDAFNRLSIEYDPNNGGDYADFMATQVNMGVIALARGEYENLRSIRVPPNRPLALPAP